MLLRQFETSGVMITLNNSSRTLTLPAWVSLCFDSDTFQLLTNVRSLLRIRQAKKKQNFGALNFKCSGQKNCPNNFFFLFSPPTFLRKSFDSLARLFSFSIARLSSPTSADSRSSRPNSLFVSSIKVA